MCESCANAVLALLFRERADTASKWQIDNFKATVHQNIKEEKIKRRPTHKNSVAKFTQNQNEHVIILYFCDINTGRDLCSLATSFSVG